MTYHVWSGTLNPTHSPSHAQVYQAVDRRYRNATSTVAA